MAATLQQHCATNNNTATRATNTATSPNPQLKRLVYSKYRELLGSYNDQANAYLDTLPSYMVHKDTGFNIEMKNSDFINSADQNGHTSAINNNQNEMYGAGQRIPAQQTFEAPACVQNAMMTKDKKPFTYTPGGIDLSQIKSERMAKRLARNAQAEGATGIQQQNRPTQPHSPSGSSPSAAAAMGAAAMGMPFQVLPPPPPPTPGKNFNSGSVSAPPPPPPSSSNFSKTGTLAPPTNGNTTGGCGSAPNSPNMPRKSPTPQRFEPPPMGFRPEIKIPPNPMAALRKVPPPVEKNTFWKDEYVKERSKSPMLDIPDTASSSNTAQNDSVNSFSSSPQTTNANYNGTAILNNDNIDGSKKTMPTATTNNVMQQNHPNNYTNYQQPQQQHQVYTPPTPPNSQQTHIKPVQYSPQYGGSQPPATPPQQTQIMQQSTAQQQSSKPEFRRVAVPTSPAVTVYTRQSDSPQIAENATPSRATDSPFKFAQQQQQQQRAPPAVSPLAQQSTPSSASSAASVSPNNQAQTVPWRSQRGTSQQPQQTTQPSVVTQSHPQPIYNNDFSSQQSAYQGPKPTNVGSLYIAPLAPPTEPQAQHIVRQQMQQQQRDSPMRQMAPQQQQQSNQQLRWMSTQPVAKEQPAWARPEENGNVVPSSLNRIKSPPPSAQAQQPTQQHMYQPLNQGNGFAPQTVPHNFGAQPVNTTGLRLQINTPVNQSNSTTGPKERIIPIQLEQTPTYTPTQPSFNQSQQHGAGSIPPAPGYVMRTPNQFVDQGYNNFGQQQQQPKRVMSPALQQLNAPRMVQQTQNNVATGNKTHIIPIAIENNEGTRGPISKTPIVIQNDQRTPPVQSKSFRILQKITDTIDDSSNDDNAIQQQQHLQQPIEPQLQRPTFARQMSAQQARHSPTVEQMRRMQIGHEQGNYSAPVTPSAIIYNQQHCFYDNSQQYLPPSEQQVLEPKKYTGSAIPSRSFKILQAMTQPENADKQENCQKNNEMNEIESKPDSKRHSSCSCNSSAVQPASSSSSTSISSELDFLSSSSPTAIFSQSLQYPPYQYPYVYPWYPLPPHISSNQNSEHCTPANWHYPYGVPSSIPTPLPPPLAATGEHSTCYPPYPYYYSYYPPPPPPHMPPHSSPQQQNNTNAQSTEFDLENMHPSYMPPPYPYLPYPYPVAPSYSQGSNQSRASSVLPDIIITPSTDDVPSRFVNHHIKIEKERSKRATSIDIASLKSNAPVDGSMVGILTHQLENMTKCIKNNLNTKCQTKKPYKKNIDQKSPEDNISPVQITMLTAEPEKVSDIDTSDSETTPKILDKKEPVPLKSIKSVNNVQIYNGQKLQQVEADYSSDSESEDEDDDETTADGESEIFDEEYEGDENHYDFELQEDTEQEEDSGSEAFVVDDSLSVIYEEESEMEKNSIMAKNIMRGDESRQSDELTLEKEHEDDGEDERDDSTSVTVRLPLKFSFSTSKDAENVTTVEVGKSQIEEKRSSTSLSEKRNAFNIATVKSESENDDSYEGSICNDCDVSVTISLTQSSKSSSMDGKVENKNMICLYPIEDMPLPEESLEKIETSQEDISVSFSLNMRNKFSTETYNGDIVNNIAYVNNEISKEQIKKVSDAPEEIDFFATLLATKMQAQKIKEQSASYWGKSIDNKYSQGEAVKKSEINENPTEELQNSARKVEDIKESKKSKLNCRKKYSNKVKTEAIETKVEGTEEAIGFQENSAKKLYEIKSEISNCNKAKNKSDNETKPKKVEDIHSKPQEKGNKPKFSFWDRCSTARKEERQQVEPEEILETKVSGRSSKLLKQKEKILLESIKQFQDDKTALNYYASAEELKTKALETAPKQTNDIWDQSEEVIAKPLITFGNECSNSKEIETSIITNEAEEIADIWADREDDLPPIKPIKSKLNSLETARNAFWSSVYETDKQTEKKQEKHLQQVETIDKVQLNMNVLRSSIMDVSQPQTACVHYGEERDEPINSQEKEETDEVDFWAEIEKGRESKTPEVQPIIDDSLIIKTYREQETKSNDTTLVNSFGEQETSMYNDDMPANPQEFDPFKYPEEPREVDTDEEIDFWAEIEAKRQAEEDDVTFHKSASFWASKEGHNSVDETPYKPVLPKAFHAKLPDQLQTKSIDIWEALEAHKGEEPLIIDPAVEEENDLAQQYDEMMQQESVEEEHHDDTVSMNESIVASVWRPQAQVNQEEHKTNFCALERQQPAAVEDITEPTTLSKPEIDELEIKRSNYRKAMAFFTTSIDENKEKSVDLYERSKSKSNRASFIEEETEQWDWDAVNEILQQEKAAENNQISNEIAVQKSFVEEQTPRIDATFKSNKEVTPLPEVNLEPSTKRLPNGLPDLEVNKFNEDRQISVKDRISAFETGAIDKPATDSRRNSIKKQSLSVESNTRQSSLSRNSSTQRSESEMDEDDSGVTDMNKQLSETDTESESFPELRKMSSYQRASTHSRLFKLLQEDPDITDNNPNADEFQFKPSRRKIVHNVSITRKQNPTALTEAETMSQRRERLSLPLRKNTSIDNDNPSTPNSPASPIMGHTANKSSSVSDKLVSELVQSLLLRSDSTHFKKLPMEKLQAAAKIVLEEELDSLENTSVDSTPAPTPCETKKDKTYADYYNTWSDALGAEDIVPSKSFRALQDSRRSPWTARCPRVLSSKTINWDLARVTESPEISMHNNKSPECFRQSREASVGMWKKS